MPSINDSFPSKYLKASDIPEEGITATMRLVTFEKIGADDKGPKPVLFVEEYDKGIVINKTNATNIAKLYGDETDDWPGKKVRIETAWVDFQGQSVEAIRIYPPKRQVGERQPQANTRMSVNDAGLNQQARTQRFDDRSPPPPTDDDIPF